MMQNSLIFYTLDRILERNARYYIIYGERSNGKTFAVLKYGLKRFLDDGSQTGIIRRWEEDFIGADSMRTCYDSLMCDGHGKNQISIMSKGKYTGVEYYGGKYYLTQNDGEKEVKTNDVIAIAFPLTRAQHSKSASFPKIKTVLFDEFMTRDRYLPDEFITFQNVLSTIIRQRDDVQIFMCANTVNKYGCPYFTEMGLYKIKEMKQGDIDLYQYGENGALRVAVEYSDAPAKKKPSDVYFAFDNPRLKMITSGSWEIDVYPHCPVKYVPKEIVFTYFIYYDEQLLQCEIINTSNGEFFTFIHRKTTPIKDDSHDVIFKCDIDPKPNYRRRITSPNDDLGRKILWFYNAEKVFYQDNDVGEVIRNYLLWCKSK